MKALAAALMIWASAHTGLPVPETMPEFRFADSCEIERFARDDGLYECSDEGRYKALYANGTIILPDTWDAGDLYYTSMLLHELVHYMQDEQGVIESAVCRPEEVERPAYEAQIAWLEAAGVDAYKVMGVNALFVVFVTMCLDEPVYAGPP